VDHKTAKSAERVGPGGWLRRIRPDDGRLLSDRQSNEAPGSVELGSMALGPSPPVEVPRGRVGIPARCKALLTAPVPDPIAAAISIVDCPAW
jgi:hypothetical protein